MKALDIREIPAEWRQMSDVFTALGDPHRQRILLLFDKGEKLNVSKIAAHSTLSRSTVSHHLKVLRRARVLDMEKRGKEVWFSINRPFLENTLSRVLDYIRENA